MKELPKTYDPKAVESKIYDLWMKGGYFKGIIDPDKDSLRFYSLGNKYQSKVEHMGAKNAYAPEGTLIL
jgi:CRISPR/Cas system-associated endoribonuclease Cas2